MKPKDLKHTYSWKDRRPLLQDRVLYVPDYYDHYDEYTFPGWSSPEIFGDTHPVHIEYCSGNGKWILERAIAHPEINWVAVEKRFDRVRKIWSKIQNHQLSNLFAVCGEGCTATYHYFPSDTVSEIYINFPDPWPKDRHAKHRLIQQPFVTQMARILGSGGAVVLVTDHEAYSEQMIAEMLRGDHFRSGYPAPHYITEMPDYGSSYFDTLWRKLGRGIHFHRFIKT